MLNLVDFASRLDRAAVRADARSIESARRASAIHADAEPASRECRRLSDAVRDAYLAQAGGGYTPPSEMARLAQAYKDACAVRDAALARYNAFVRPAVDLDAMSACWAARAGRFRRRASALRVAQGFEDFEGHFAEAFEVMDYGLARWLAPLCAVSSEVEEGGGLDRTDTFIFKFADGSEALFYESPDDDSYVDAVAAGDLA